MIRWLVWKFGVQLIYWAKTSPELPRVIYREENTVLLRRWYLFRNRWFGVMLHKFENSDTAGHHDHPWNNASVVLHGSYREEFPDGTVAVRRPGDFYWRRAEQFHRVVLDQPNEPVWTLFLVGRRRRNWGFLPEHTPWRQGPNNQEIGGLV